MPFLSNVGHGVLLEPSEYEEFKQMQHWWHHMQEEQEKSERFSKLNQKLNIEDNAHSDHGETDMEGKFPQDIIHFQISLPMLARDIPKIRNFRDARLFKRNFADYGENIFEEECKRDEISVGSMEATVRDRRTRFQNETEMKLPKQIPPIISIFSWILNKIELVDDYWLIRAKY